MEGGGLVPKCGEVEDSWICRIDVVVLIIFGIERDGWVPGETEIARRKVRKERFFARSSVPVTFIAVRDATAKEGVACLLIRSELRFAGHHVVVFRGKRVDFTGCFKGCYRLRDLVESSVRNTAIDRAQVNGQRIGSGRRWGHAAHPIGMVRPLNGERLHAPDALRQDTIRAPRHAIYHASGVD